MATSEHRVSSGERINANARPGKLQAALEGRGVRLTRQRRVLLQVMDSAERHLDAGSILRRAQKIDRACTASLCIAPWTCSSATA